jgi:outer membrane protein
MFRSTVGSSLLLVAALASHPVLAGGKIGIGLGMAPDYEGSDDTEGTPSLFGRYQWDSGRYVALGGTQEAGRALRLKANLISDAWSPTWELGPVLQYRMERDDVDNNRVDRMKKVDSATELGAFVGFKSGPWAASLTYATDVSDEHDGSVTELAGSYHLPINDAFSLKFGASVSYADDDYMDTYFGVNGKNKGKSGFSNYNAGSGIKDYGLSATAEYALNPSWGLQGGISYYRLTGDAEDSPLVDGVGDENQLSASVAVTYSF